MTKKRALILVAVVLVLAALVYLQFREWRRFDWGTFARVTRDLVQGRHLWHLLTATALIYSTYLLRAVRWKLFLKPVCHARLRSLVPTQYIGFTGLALLGRPGELIRPYLIARKENLTVSSQMAVWTVERIFDIGAFGALVSVDIFVFGDRLPRLPVSAFGHRLPGSVLEWLAAVLLAAVAVMGIGAYYVRRNGSWFADAIERRLAPVSPKLSGSVCQKIRSFGEGLNTIKDTASFLQIALVSLAIWFVIALAYRHVLHAYSQPVLGEMQVPEVLLLMAASMVGSLIQLPAVGGGSQLAVISMLSSPEWFGVPRELAVSAGMLLWLVTFMAVIPAGLALAHHEHVSLRKFGDEGESVRPAAPVAVQDFR
ncbi:MAG: lysylphosphatidylglycerol synthase transmembrane domain-containing protein [Terriglobales bacterium]